ncbi:ABC transporter ATP-binding protein [Odoribacter sp. OttesenSCG-928-J03]|nr:ABC transporter ATP-binding protein [Odoribacter sp. OttesenSCG-928-J03]MDL2283197.1 ABC transporter ATP-binding protein [Odoribacter sp. OttesenSCG-928-G04]MDL2331010.1 ABC transporter ATP-binding protein [Odoribacter sp. OttesenSCG-928-A06]
MDVVVENLSKSFGSQKAVDSVSFNVKKGEVLGILGPNGAGKTTIMKIITCFLFPDSGNVFIDNHSIHKHAYKIKQYIGYLSENNPLYEDMNVVDFLKFVANIHNIPRYKIPARVMDMLRVCGLEGEKHKNIRELSKGYKQRIGLAQALIHEPEVIILDEPTTGLDPNQIFDIRELIKETGKEKTIILSSHILAEIEATCNRVLILNKGQIVANGTSAELRKANTGKTLHVRIRGGSIHDIHRELASIEDVSGIEIIDNECVSISSSRTHDIEKYIFEVCNTHNWYITELTPIEKGLEDIFRQLTQN